jgi:hypothetical protein
MILDFSFRRKIPFESKYTILYGFTKNQIFKNNDFRDFHDYLVNSNIEAFKVNQYVIEADWLWTIKTHKNAIFCNNPILVSALMMGDNRSKKAIFTGMLRDYFVLIWKIFSTPELRLIVKDIFVNQQILQTSILKPKFVIATPNNLYTQPLAFFYFDIPIKKIMIWYSASAIKHDVSQFYIDDSFYEFLPIDYHYVWTLEHKLYLDRITKKVNIVVGPQLFYLSTQSMILKKRKVIALFDITPTDWKIYEKTPYGVERCTWFLKTAIEAINLSRARDLNYRIEFKYKRRPEEIHSNHYLDLVKQYVSTEQIQLVDPDINLFDYLKEVDVIISTRLTSVGIIAEQLHVPTFYLESVDYTPKLYLDFWHASSAQELGEMISKFLSKLNY